MKGKMSITVRLLLSDMLAKLENESSRILLYREFRGKLSFSEEENILLGVRVVTQGSGFMTYADNPENDPMKEIEVGEIITEVACTILKELEDTKQINDKNLDLFLWFKPEIDKMRKREKEAAKPQPGGE